MYTLLYIKIYTYLYCWDILNQYVGTPELLRKNISTGNNTIGYYHLIYILNIYLYILYIYNIYLIYYLMYIWCICIYIFIHILHLFNARKKFENHGILMEYLLHLFNARKKFKLPPAFYTKTISFCFPWNKYSINLMT